MSNSRNLDDTRHGWDAGDDVAASLSRHSVETTERAAERARAIVDAAPRTEFVGAADFLHALLRTAGAPQRGGSSTVLRAAPQESA